MHTIEIIYLISAICSLAAMLPQIKKLQAAKDSQDFSLTTWTVWSIGQFCSLMYAILVGAYAYVLVSSVWIMLYSYMVSLIIRYKPHRYEPAPKQQLQQHPLTDLALDIEMD